MTKNNILVDNRIIASTMHQITVPRIRNGRAAVGAHKNRPNRPRLAFEKADSLVGVKKWHALSNVSWSIPHLARSRSWADPLQLSIKPLTVGRLSWLELLATMPISPCSLSMNIIPTTRDTRSSMIGRSWLTHSETGDSIQIFPGPPNSL